MKEGEALESGLLTKQIEKAQKKVEEYHFDQRKNLLEYDEVMDHQRKRTYGFRQSVLDGKNPRAMVLEMIDAQTADAVKRYAADDYGTASFATYVSGEYGVEFDPADFRGATFDEAVKIAQDRAGQAAPTFLQEAFDENLNPSEDAKDWKWQELARVLNTRYGLKLSDRELKKVGREQLDEFILAQGPAGDRRGQPRRRPAVPGQRLRRRELRRLGAAAVRVEGDGRGGPRQGLGRTARLGAGQGPGGVPAKRRRVPGAGGADGVPAGESPGRPAAGPGQPVPVRADAVSGQRRDRGTDPHRVAGEDQGTRSPGRAGASCRRPTTRRSTPSSPTRSAGRRRPSRRTRPSWPTGAGPRWGWRWTPRRSPGRREGWTAVEVFADAALSGATTLRPSFQALLAAMRAGQLDMVLAESLDRFSRDQEHIAGFYKLACFARVQVFTLAEGPRSPSCMSASRAP